MPRALWKGSISFGLVNIPIELHTAVRDHRPKFRMLHAKDTSPVRFERVCIRDGHPVAWDDLVKGYEYAKGHFVVLTKEDFQAAAVDKTRTVDIIDFVKSEEIDDRFFETPFAKNLRNASREFQAEIGADQFVFQFLQCLSVEFALRNQTSDGAAERGRRALEPAAQAFPPISALCAVVHVAPVIAVSA